MRNPVACVSCRSAKQKCIHNDSPPCDRCKATGRADLCEFPPPGTSAIHRRPKRPRLDSGDSPPGVNSHTQHLGGGFKRSESTVHTGLNGLGGGTGVSPPSAVEKGSPASTTSLLDGLDPFDMLTDEVKNSYLRCAYKWSFHHTPTLLLGMRDRTLEIWMVWAILALAIRFVKEPPPPFRTQKEASNAFAAHARQILQSDLETPSISRVQALLMLTGHDWGAGNGRRAWIYLGMAIRLIEVMDLCQEPPLPKDRAPTKEEFIEAEVRRRTAWTCFLMDSLLSGGKGRKRSLEASDMAQIQLPCEKESFVFGEPVVTQRLDGSLRMPPSGSLPIGELGIIAYSLRAANIWGKVAKWACSDIVNTELPWSPTSQFQSLSYDLLTWKKSLPPRLQYDLFSLHSHNAVDQGQAYCYMHCIHFMSNMFLHRAYLPVIGSQNGADETTRSYNEHTETWKNWQKRSRADLFKEASQVLEMLDEMRTFGVYFLRGLVPWIGFTIYTAVGVMLYSFNFPSGEDDPGFPERAKEKILHGCTFLREMKTQWPMAETWFQTIKRMQAFYRTVHGEGTPVSPDEQQTLRRAMVDYGALQTSPVQKLEDIHIADASQASIREHAHQPQQSPPQSQQIITPPTSTVTPTSHPSTFYNQQQSYAMEGDELFDFGVDMSHADFEAMMTSATQDFWASFPGEVGVGYPTM